MKRLTLAGAVAIAILALPAWANGIGSLARVSVYDRSDNRELPVYWRDGRAYVAGKPGNEYQVRVRNAAGEDLLAVVSVDGVNVVSGESAQAAQSGYVIGSYASMDVAGWRKNMERTAAFYFTTLPDSYAARTGRPENVGVIGVALFKRKPPEPIAYAPPMPFSSRESAGGPAQPAAPDVTDHAARSESLNATAKRAPTASPLGTGHGRGETNHARWVAFERASSHPVETITIYYDSTRNLVAQGVIRAVPRARNPNPFPGFVPDPVSQLRHGYRDPIA